MRLGVKLACSLSQLQREFLSCQMDVDKATDTLTVLIGIWVKNSRIVADDNMGDDCSFSVVAEYIGNSTFIEKDSLLKTMAPFQHCVRVQVSFIVQTVPARIYIHVFIYIYLFPLFSSPGFPHQ